MKRFLPFLLVLLAISRAFSAEPDIPANLIVSIIVFLLLFTVIVPVAKSYSNNPLSVIVLAGSISFIVSYAVYANPLISNFMFDFAPYLIVLAVGGSFIYIISILKDNKSRIIVILMTVIVIIAFLALNGNIIPGINISSVHDETVIGADIGLFIVAALFIALVVFSLLMVFK
ncbi:Uncharacterised protein [Candidatus Tiddalikarchaeum anstoanum]|nr:Uncharacterised protein [Candidatus Tiddalikarchaeum anstoanum]